MKLRAETGVRAACAVLSMAGLATAIWVVVSGLPGKEGIDAMFLLIVGLTFALVFGAIPARTLRRPQWKLRARTAGVTAGTKANTEAAGDRGATA